MKISVGVDPELFVWGGKEFINGSGLIPGTKKNPFPVNRGAVQVDGIALEFNTEPAEDEDTFAYNIGEVLSQLQSMIPYELKAQPTISFNVASLPAKDRILGCDTDFNAWTDKSNPQPDENLNFRTGAGHIHIGWTSNANIKSDEHRNMCIDLTKQCDFFLGLPSLLFDSDTDRRKLYGKAGAFRPKTYGVEYRVLSNMWVNHPTLYPWIFNACHNAVHTLIQGIKMWEKYTDLENIINYSDVDKATEIINNEKQYLEMPHV